MMKRSKYNDGQETVCCDGIKFYDKPSDSRVLVFENCDGEKTELFKCNLIVCLVGIAACKQANEDYRRPEINKTPFIALHGQENCCTKAGEVTVVSLTAKSEAALIELHKNLQKMCCTNGALLYREQFTSQTGAFTVGYTLPTDGDKTHVYKNGQKLVEGNANGYTRSGNVITPATATATDVFEVIVFA